MPITAKGNINHWHIAEQMDCNMPTFNEKGQFFQLYMIELFYISYKMAPE
jgi:hypothetical protein